MRSHPADGFVARVYFYNASCRDFLLRFIEEHTTYYMKLLRAVTSSSQLSLLLGYAASHRGDGRDRWQYPNMARSVRAHATELAQRVREVWITPEEPRGGSVGRAAAILSEYQALNGELTLGLDDWINSTTLTLGMTLYDGSVQGFQSLRELVTAVIASVGEGRMQLNNEDERSLEHLFDVWTRTAAAEDQFNVIDSVIEAAAVPETLTSKFQGSLLTAVGQWLNDELMHLGSERPSDDFPVHDMQSELTTLTRVRDKYFGDGQYAEELADVEREVSAYENYEPNPEDLLDFSPGDEDGNGAVEPDWFERLNDARYWAGVREQADAVEDQIVRYFDELT